MTQVSYRINVIAGWFPFLSQFQGQTIIVPQIDQDYVDKLNPTIQGEENAKPKGIPQIFYGHNIAPTFQGLQSVGYRDRLPGIPGETLFKDIFVLRDPDENKYLFSPAHNKNYLFDGNVGTWAEMTTPPDIDEGQIVTVAYVNGHSYVFFQGDDIYEYNSTTHTLDPVTLIGITPAALHGICSASGFLIAWDNFTVYRSSALDVLDFTPDPTVGAGSSIPEDIKGQIVCCLPINNGFIIYTTKNAVGASFSQNIRYPFIYKEVQGSAGILMPSHVSWQDNSGVHYAWTQAGIQTVTKTQALTLYPDVTDFLTSGIFEDFDTTTNTFTNTLLTSALLVRLAVIGRRFLVISYGIEGFTHALMYDISLKRWGKLKINHVAAFELYLPNLFGTITWAMLSPLTWEDLGNTVWRDLSTQLFTFERPKELLALLQEDGTVKVVEFDLTDQDDNEGVLVLGKYQYLRSRFLILDQIDLENIQVGKTFNIVVLPTIDGKNFISPVSPYLNINTDLFRSYLARIEAKNHTLVAKGNFHLTSGILTFHVGGHN